VVLAADAADPGDETAVRRNQHWANEVMDGLAPMALPGGYVNFLGPADGDRVAAFYGPALARLTELKNRYDPGRLFGSVTGIGSIRTPS
jgi:hypothetical protein